MRLQRDPAKRWSWPVHLATLRARLRVPVVLLVVCPDRASATWCSAPIELGHPGWALRPVVIAPDQVPVLTDPEEAVGSPELAVLSAMAHGAGTDGDKVLSAFMTGLRALSDDQANSYTDLVLMTLPAAARARLEELMSTGTWEYKSDFARRYYGQGRAEGREEGRAEGEARAVLGVLDARGIDVPSAAREWIMGCTDLDQLELWVRQAVTVSTVDELFA